MKKGVLVCSMLLASTLLGVANIYATSDPSAVIDNLSVTVDEICTFSRTAGSATITKAMTANKGATAMNSSANTFKAICNGGSGYSVAATWTALSSASNSTTFVYNASPTKGYNRWAAYANGSSTALAASNAKLMDTSSADDSEGTTATVIYKVSTASDVPAGSYTGTATYTLTQK